MGIEALLAALTPEARIDAIDVGAQFNKDQVLGQIQATRLAFASTGSELAQHGFTVADDAELGEIEAALRDATHERSGATIDTRAGRDAYRRVVTRAKAAVKNGVAVLRNLASAVARKPDPTNPKAASQLTASLALVGPVGRAATKVSNQLDLLLQAFGDPAIAKAGEGRGATEAKARLESGRRELDEAQRNVLGGGGTPPETQAQNLLEGLAVLYLREARKAARSAADRLGDPALAKTYELSVLYAGGNARPSTPTETPNPSESTPPTPQ